jgi:hypothetical protein
MAGKMIGKRQEERESRPVEAGISTRSLLLIILPSSSSFLFQTCYSIRLQLPQALLPYRVPRGRHRRFSRRQDTRFRKL